MKRRAIQPERIIVEVRRRHPSPIASKAWTTHGVKWETVVREIEKLLNELVQREPRRVESTR